MVATDRRNFDRRNTDIAIQVLVVPANSSGRENTCEIVPAKMTNQSREGLYLETHRPLQPGSNITIRMDGLQGIPPSQNAYHMHDGRIIWCHQINDEPPRFGIGVKILRKAVQADIMTSRFGPSAAGSPGA